MRTSPSHLHRRTASGIKGDSLLQFFYLFWRPEFLFSLLLLPFPFKELPVWICTLPNNAEFSWLCWWAVRRWSIGLPAPLQALTHLAGLQSNCRCSTYGSSSALFLHSVFIIRETVHWRVLPAFFCDKKVIVTLFNICWFQQYALNKISGLGQPIFGADHPENVHGPLVLAQSVCGQLTGQPKRREGEYCLSGGIYFRPDSTEGEWGQQKLFQKWQLAVGAEGFQTVRAVNMANCAFLFSCSLSGATLHGRRAAVGQCKRPNEGTKRCLVGRIPYVSRWGRQHGMLSLPSARQAELFVLDRLSFSCSNTGCTQMGRHDRVCKSTVTRGRRYSPCLRARRTLLWACRESSSHVLRRFQTESWARRGVSSRRGLTREV